MKTLIAIALLVSGCCATTDECRERRERQAYVNAAFPDQPAQPYRPRYAMPQSIEPVPQNCRVWEYAPGQMRVMCY